LTPAPSPAFTIRDYQSILDAARTHGYVFGRFTDPEPEPTTHVIYLRHDIDNCIESALRMAELEARAGVVSTYLTMVRSANYNPFTRAGLRALRRIQDLGHEVGLHFTAEEHEPEDLETDLAACIRADATLLENAIGTRPRVFSFHNPSEQREFRVEVSGLVNAYADRFFRDVCYLSESNMGWRHGSPVEVLAERRHRIVQVLVHPLSYRADFKSDRDVLLWFLRDTVRRLLSLNVGQNRVLREQGVSLADVAACLLEDGEE
jgi:hypothetical protein